MKTDIVIRPSSLNTLLGCPQQWYRVFVLGQRSMPNARALIGTSVHKGIEAMWTESMRKGMKDANLGMMNDAAVETFDSGAKEAEGSLYYDGDLDANKARALIVRGNNAFVETILPWTEIPDAVEKHFSKPIDHPMVKAIAGTVDYIGYNCIADVKTSKSRIIPQGHSMQQSIYKMLVENSGYTVNACYIQGIAFTAKTKAGIHELMPNVAQAKFIVNNLLDRLTLLYNDKVDPDILFPGNPKYYLCSNIYCAFRANCSFVQGG